MATGAQPKGAPRGRLSKAERRTQLLETATRIVREQGSDALTLSSLAEAAGVTKPITYEHFGTREGLLIALYQHIDDGQIALLERALARTEPSLAQVARVISRAYMECCRAIGAEWYAVSSALHGDERMERFQRELGERYVRLYVDAFAPHSALRKAELRLRCIALLGAAEAIAREMIAGRVAFTQAVNTLQALILSAL